MSSPKLFLEHFAYGAQNVALNHRSARCRQWPVVAARAAFAARGTDAQPDAEAGAYQLRMAEGNAADLLNDSVPPLNAKLGQNCLSLALPPAMRCRWPLPAPAMPMPPRWGLPAASWFAGSGRTGQAGAAAHNPKPVRGVGRPVPHREVQHICCAVLHRLAQG